MASGHTKACCPTPTRPRRLTIRHRSLLLGRMQRAWGLRKVNVDLLCVQHPTSKQGLKQTLVPVSIVAAFTIGRGWKPPKCPSTDMNCAHNGASSAFKVHQAYHGHTRSEP